MGDSVSFKAYLKRDGQDVEVRRFGIDSGAATNYMYLRNKIQAMFPSIQNDQFNVFWQDSDKDYVAIGSDEELLEALTSGLSQPFKLFVNITSKQQPEQGVPGQPQAHTGVVCDSCEKGIVGFRYKCVTCSDFDLCAACEGAGKHSEHFMLRMPFPLGPGSCHPKYFRKLFDHPRKFHKFAKHYPQFAAFASTRCPFQNRAGPSAPAQEPKGAFDFSALLDFITSMTAGVTGEGQVNEPAANAQTSSNSQATPGQQTGPQERRPEATGDDYLNGIGQAISAFLDPFGIDVSFDVRSRTSETTAPPQQNTTNSEQPTPNNSSAPSPSQQNAPESSQQSVPAPSQETVPSPASSPRESFHSAEKQPTPVPEPIPLTARRNSDDWTVISRESPIRSEVAMDVDEARAAKSTAEVPKETPTAPPAPQAETSSVDRDRQRIQEAINNIRSMGFNYETTLLRELLRRENGDIASVLETILNNTNKK